MKEHIAFYHDGPAPSKEVRDALEAKRLRPAGRNSAVGFSYEEEFTLVVVDGSDSAKKIGDFYKAKGVPVQSIEEYIEGDKPAPVAVTEPAFNPDAPVAQREPGAQPKKK